MKRTIQAHLGLLLLTLIAGTAAAQTLPKQEAKQMDTNLDGTLSADEHESGVEATFDSIDADEDDFITADELDAAREAKGDAATQSSADRIAALDIDKDGRVSETEHAAGAKEAFKDADASTDGNLNPDEIKAADDAAKAATPIPD